MYDNPWNVDNIARMQRERLQEEMRQIRMEQAAERAQVQAPHRSLLSLLLGQAWLQRWRKRPARVPQRKATT